MTEFTLDWPHGHMTRDGRPARIVATDREHSRQPPIVALVSEKGDEIILTYFNNGHYYGEGEGAYDLINRPAPKRHGEVWANIYSSRTTDEAVNVHTTRDEADRAAGRNRLACVRVEWTEGEGL